MSKTADGWLEEEAMGSARARLLESLARVDAGGRFRIYTPVTAGGEDIYVHAKVMIVDDVVLRVGSSNWNNRSLGLDSECDVIVDAQLPTNASARQTIKAIRNDLLAEHLGVKATDVASAVDGTNSIIAAVERLRVQGKTLVPYEAPEINSAEEFRADNEILDPEQAGGFFEPLGNLGLFHSKIRLKAPRTTTD